MSSVVGQCMQMCPQEELILRERERLLHPLEMLPGTEKHKIPTADRTRTIKCYSRSAAGVNLTRPDQLRPPSILHKTVEHIISNTVNDDRFTLTCRYDFICDRFRAISQDMIIQRVSAHYCIQIYEPIVKFYVLFGYRLCEEDISKYDPTLHKKSFMEYLKRLLVCYDEVEMNSSSIYSKMFYKMETLQISKNVHSEENANRPLLETIYLMSNIGDTNTLLRYLSLPQKYQTSLVNLAFQLSLSHVKGNFVQVCNALPKLHVLALCTVYLQLPSIRKSALKIMNVAFHSKNLTYPMENLKTILLYDTINDLHNDCKLCGIKCINNVINFDKNAFIDNSVVKIKRSQIIEEKLKERNIHELLL
ncbi:uncharacterized protein LOC143916276 [Arctopsyche grandis]|uniref:uncharacterized protein LOC143916276 n=1 Tax=Arctopsyche grandis TaxID=121162 RepID=UPI00406D734D